MKLIMTGLPPLVVENQQILTQVILRAMHFYHFKVDGIHIEFEGDDT